ncbi:MAG TPA: hydantoinase B/oxoprolinase family protein [Candidatus Limnocylindria bacterium]|nr:hydantoinase B/oxoprolinase family protein [Candidatus Limnocylindria bacterium]
MSAEAVRLALDQGRFAACAEEMGATLMRTAHSPNIKERLDHSCALFDARGRLVAQAAHIPVHLGSLPRAVAAALARGPLGPGDVVLLNDPYQGGTHLPDLTLVSPVFLGRGSARRSHRAPDFVLATRAHHADVGGSAPGSMPLARDVYAEGLRLPPVLLMRGGRPQEDVWTLVLANVRTPDERRADLGAQLGAHATGERRLMELTAHAGRKSHIAALQRAARALMAYSERRVRAALRLLPRGRFAFADALDDDGLGSRAVPIHVTLEASGGRLSVDFTGSSPQVPGPINAVEAVTCAATYYAVQCVLAGDWPINHGAFAPIEITAPAGTVVNPRPPAAVGAGNVETSQRIVDVVLGAFARALPDRVPAASSGTMNNLLIGGDDPRTGRPFAYYETLAGGHGAGPGWPGQSAMQAHMTNTRNTPIEALEHAYPLRVGATRIRRGSGGRGRFRGGDGIERVLELRAPARVTVISDRRRTGPYGLAGGRPGARGVNRVQSRATRASARTLPGKFQIDLDAGAMLTVASPGGGGFGRAPRARVRRRAPPRGRYAPHD